MLLPVLKHREVQERVLAVDTQAPRAAVSKDNSGVRRLPAT